SPRAGGGAEFAAASRGKPTLSGAAGPVKLAVGAAARIGRMEAATVGWLFLAASAIGAGCTAGALLRVRRLGWLTFPYFMVAWLTGELALHHLVWQAAATLLFVAGGALQTLPGRVGLGLTLASWLGLWVAHRRTLPASAAMGAGLRESLPDVDWEPITV